MAPAAWSFRVGCRFNSNTTFAVDLSGTLAGKSYDSVAVTERWL
jgi:hypothetical protein